MKIEIEKEKLDAMLDQLAVELAPMLKAEAEVLAKGAKEDAPAEESEGSSEPASPPPSEESAPAEESAPPADGPPAEGSAPPMDAPPPEASAAPGPEASAPGQEQQAIEPAPTVEALQAEYAQLDPEALKMHYLAAKSALLAVMGAQGGGPEASAAPAPMAPPPPAPEASAPAPMAMGEMKGKQLPNNPGNGGKLGKSESDVKIEALEKQVSEQNSALDGLAKAFEKLTTPTRKAVTGISQLKYVNRTESEPAKPVASLTKAEVREKLKDKVREGKLSKSDKDLVASYTVGSVDISKIEHLLVNAATK